MPVQVAEGVVYIMTTPLYGVWTSPSRFCPTCGRCPTCGQPKPETFNPYWPNLWPNYWPSNTSGGT